MSPTSPPVLPRALAPVLREALETSPVVVVTGARQTGKSTLARLAGSSDRRPYVTLDDPDALEQARGAPQEFVRRMPLITIDEVQRAPDLLLAVKRAVDEHRVPGRFLLTGSANLLLLRRVAETLAGRATYLTLWPVTRRELLGFGSAGSWTELFEHDSREWLDVVLAEEAPPGSWDELAVLGGYPVPAYHLSGPAARERWFDGFARTYVERDLSDLAAVEHVAALRRLMRAAALRLGGLLNQADLSRDVGLPPTTAQRYLDLLEAAYQLIRLPAYAVNRTKRLLKSPKLYWSDTGMAMHLAGAEAPGGAHFENLVLSDLLVWKELQPGRPEILHWRTTKGAEVDFVVEWGGRLLAIEAKGSAQLRLADARHLKTFLQEYPETRGGLVLYDGDDTYWLADRVLAVPWWRML